MKIDITIPGYTDIATVDSFNDMHKAMIDGQLINHSMPIKKLLALMDTLMINGSYIGHVELDKRLSYVIKIRGVE